jgi:hypothetical protein
MIEGTVRSTLIERVLRVGARVARARIVSPLGVDGRPYRPVGLFRNLGAKGDVRKVVVLQKVAPP